MAELTAVQRLRAVQSPQFFPILPFYRGIYDCAYIALHPFSDAGGVDVRWECVRRACGFQTLGALNLAVAACYFAVRDEFVEAGAVAVLKQILDAHGWDLPEQDEFPGRMQAQLARMFRDAALVDVEIGDNLGNRSRLSVDEMSTGTPWNELPARSELTLGVSLVVAADRSLLALVDFDTTATLICGRADRLSSLELSARFEGFDVSGNATGSSWWWAPPSSPYVPPTLLARAIECNGLQLFSHDDALLALGFAYREELAPTSIVSIDTERGSVSVSLDGRSYFSVRPQEKEPWSSFMRRSHDGARRWLHEANARTVEGPPRFRAYYICYQTRNPRDTHPPIR